MDQFNAAIARYEKKHQKRLGQQVGEMGTHPTIMREPPPKPVPVREKPPKISGRHNEIDVSIWIGGQEYRSSFKVPLAGSLMSSQLTHPRLKELVGQMVAAKFGKATPL